MCSFVWAAQDFGDDGETYRRQLYIITRYVRKHFREELSVLAIGHSIARIVERLDRAATKLAQVTKSPKRPKNMDWERILER